MRLATLACVSLALVSCSSTPPSESRPSSSAAGAASSASPTSVPTPPPTATASADGYDAYCAATVAAAAAKARTVGEDITAVRAQAEATRALSLSEVSAEIAAGAQVFAQSADDTVAVLEQFPADSSVADVGLDPRFAAVAQEAATDPDYQAFLAWTLQTCDLLPSGG
jgi:hypothetical protein